MAGKHRPGEIRGKKRRRVMRRLWKAARGFCTYCLAKLKRWEATIDHMTPLSRGGTSEPWNLTLACVECNLDKGSLTFEEYMRMRYA